MKTLSLQQKIIAGVAILIAVAVFGWCQRREGQKVGAVDQEIKAAAVVVTARKAAAGVELKKSVAKRAEYHAARAKVELKGDTVIADGQSVFLPSVANLVKVADSRGEQDSTSIAKQNLLIGSLDHHVDLLQEAKRPRCSTKCGIVIGTAATVTVVVVVAKVIQWAARRHG
jgi:hypothetical protein